MDGGTGGNYIDSYIPQKVQGSLKSRFNENIGIVNIPGRAKEWQITIHGYLTGGNRDDDEVTLKSYDDGRVLNLDDGLHNGNYVIISLDFPKNNTLGKVRTEYNLTIRQYTQTLPS